MKIITHMAIFDQNLTEFFIRYLTNLHVFAGNFFKNTLRKLSKQKRAEQLRAQQEDEVVYKVNIILNEEWLIDSVWKNLISLQLYKNKNATYYLVKKLLHILKSLNNLLFLSRDSIMYSGHLPKRIWVKLYPWLLTKTKSTHWKFFTWFWPMLVWCRQIRRKILMVKTRYDFKYFIIYF